MFAVSFFKVLFRSKETCKRQSWNLDPALWICAGSLGRLCLPSRRRGTQRRSKGNEVKKDKNVSWIAGCLILNTPLPNSAASVYRQESFHLAAIGCWPQPSGRQSGLPRQPLCPHFMGEKLVSRMPIWSRHFPDPHPSTCPWGRPRSCSHWPPALAQPHFTGQRHMVVSPGQFLP